MEQKHSLQPGMRLHDQHGRRLYLNEQEREAFIAQAHKSPEPIRSFCLLLIYSGCRISEATGISKQDILLGERSVCLRTLKRRSKTEFRYVPVPSDVLELLTALVEAHDPQRSYLFSAGQFPPPRVRAYRWVKSVMAELELNGPNASPKGLRHTFGAHATLTGVQLQMLQRWMGHASMETTAIYATLIGKEEREIAKRMWK